tara:strand:- start:416 stop:607 length:192 start_codon:yes stop_codon:yes gene_type:complete
MNLLIKQAYRQPFVYFTFNFVAGAQIEGYSHIRQLKTNGGTVGMKEMKRLWFILLVTPLFAQE